MGKITKTMQSRHKETLSPWLEKYVEETTSTPLPLLPKKLGEFPSRWPFPRGDLYHWIPLLNRFDNILEAFCATHGLNEGFQTRDFTCELLLNQAAPVEYCDDQPWSKDRLGQLGFGEDGDCQLIIAILNFSQMLLQHCGNRSIYGSSSRLNDLLNTTSLTLVRATLEVSLELAQRYHASMKRVTQPSRQVSSALLANHYNIELDRVNLLAQPFVKTPVAPVARFTDVPPTTPGAPTSKAKDKTSGASSRNVASMYANDLASLVVQGSTDESRWNGWGDLKVVYYPKAEGTKTPAPEAQSSDRASSSTIPPTPTPLRRSATSVSQTPRSNRPSGPDDSPSNRHGNGDDHAPSGPKTLEIRQTVLKSTSIYDLLKQCPDDMPAASRYEFLNRLRIAKALLGSTEDRRQALAVRLLAITNLASIHHEQTFIEKVLKQDNDEPRKYQLVYQLAELIHPSVDGAEDTPLWLQAIALGTLEGIVGIQAKYQDIVSALNANVNHGVLMYVVRKAVASMKQDDPDMDNGKVTDADKWRSKLFGLALHMIVSQRIGPEMTSNGLLEVLIEILKLRTKTAQLNWSMVVAFLDTIVYNYTVAFPALSNASGLDAIADLIIHVVHSSKELAEKGLGTKPEFHAQLVDYGIPFYHQQTVKWLLKFLHHILQSPLSFGANTDRLLRNLVDNSKLLVSLRTVIEEPRLYGSVVWTNAVTLLSDFLNNDPTSFAALSESGMVQSFLSTLTGEKVGLPQPEGSPRPEENPEEAASPAYSNDSLLLDSADSRPHPPTEDMMNESRERPLAHGVLASNDAINIIPQVLNSISLNNAGMKMVVSSRSFDHFLEIFFSPEHVQIMSRSDLDLAANIGSSFDELARHHPRLRPTISNSVLDLTAKVVHLANDKAKGKGLGARGWGANLLVEDSEKNIYAADKSLLAKAGTPFSSGSKEKGKDVSDDADVEMVDAAGESPEWAPEATKRSEEVHHEVTPYIWALCSFLSALFASNTNLKQAYVKNGGVELLLNLSESPALPEGFDKTTASRMLSQVLSHLIECCPVLGIPSLLNRIDDTIGVLQPLMTRDDSEPFFAPFVSGVSLSNDKGEWDPELVRRVASGNDIIKAIVRLQSLVKTSYQSFPYAARLGSIVIPPCNTYDLYDKLIKSLGALLRDAVTEDLAIRTLVPKRWTESLTSPDGAELSVAKLTVANSVTATETAPAAPQASGTEASAQPSEPTKLTAEKQEVQQWFHKQNFNTIHDLLSSLHRNVLPFFQTMSKVLLPRRFDNFSRSNQLTIAETLATTVLEQLRFVQDKLDQDKLAGLDFQHFATTFQSLHDMLIDVTRQTERQGTALLLPVLIAFKENGGIDLLSSMLEKFADDICSVPADSTAREESPKVRQATMGMKRILDIYHIIVSGKNVTESLTSTSLPKAAERNREFGHQLVVELRVAILPVVRKLWESQLAEKVETVVLSKMIDILQTIAAADSESNAYRRSDKTGPPPVFKDRKRVSFNWEGEANVNVKKLIDKGNDEELSREAIYRANGKLEDAMEYCRAFDPANSSKGWAFKRNPIPEEDAYKEPPPPPKPEQAQPDQIPVVSQPVVPLGAEPMALDPMPGINSLIHDAIGEADSGDHSSDESNDTSNESSSQHSAQEAPSTTAAPTQQAPTSSSVAAVPPNPPSVTKEDLDDERARLANDLIDRCLDVIRAHPDSVFEISDLIQNMILKTDNEQKRTEVGEILANALLSLHANDEADKKANGGTIAAYSHLLSLLLQNSSFFKSTLPTLRQYIEEYLSFLQVPSNSGEELPPWMPYVLLVFETLLIDEEQLPDIKWKPPAKEEDPVEEPVWATKVPTIPLKERSGLLSAVLEILPRIGKEEALAVSVLRILVILTRDHGMAKTVGEKRNLQRLFVMAKQLCAGGSGPLNRSRITDYIMTILRHIVEDEDIIRQVMQNEIRQFLSSSSRSGRNYDAQTFLKHLSHVALRSPKLFVETTGQLVKLVKWSVPEARESSSRSNYQIVLKPAPAAEEEAKPKDSSVEPTVQATEDLSINDVKPSTESADKEMTDAPKTPLDIKRPVLENPDGVVHFLLCELLNYREVDDKEVPAVPAKEASKTDNKTAGETSSAEEDATPAPADEEVPEPKKDEKKSSKPTFKAEDHPIFIYRCFLLSCLTELLQSYTRAKVEFINFKRSAPMQTNTPIKPRSSVLNYLLNDLLSPGSASLAAETPVAKKKSSTSAQAQSVLVALVARTGEKPYDRHRGNWEYDDEPDLLFVRRFVLDTVLRAYKDASTPGESFDVRYPRMIALAELMSHMIGEKDKDANSRGASQDQGLTRSYAQIKRLMYEKGYLATLTASIADIDLTYPDVKRTIKHILRVLRSLTKTASALSELDIIPATATGDQPEDDFASASSLSDMDDEREETPDLYRNSTLGMLEPGREDDYYSDEEEDGIFSNFAAQIDELLLMGVDDDEMYDEEVYEDELDYGDEMSQDEEDNPSDEDEEELGEMGEVEGLPGDPGVVEVIMGEDDDEDEDMDEDDEDDSDEDDEDEVGSEDMEDVEDQVEIMDEEGNPIGDDGDDGWESETDEEDEEGEEELDYEAEAQNLHNAQMMQELAELESITRRRFELRGLAAAGDADELDGEDIHEFDDEHYMDDGGPEDDGMSFVRVTESRYGLLTGFSEEEEEEEVDDDMYYEQGHPHDDFLPGNISGSLGWDLAVEPHHRVRGGFSRRNPFPAPFGVGDLRHMGSSGRLSDFFIRLRQQVGATLQRLDDLQATLDSVEISVDGGNEGSEDLSQALRTASQKLLERQPAEHRANAIPDFRNYFGNTSRAPPAVLDSQRNPLLLPSHRSGRDQSPRHSDRQSLPWSSLGLPESFRAMATPDGPLAVIHTLVQNMPIPHGAGPALSLQLTSEGPHGEIRQVSIPLDAVTGNRVGRWEPRRDVYQEPAQAVQFVAARTNDRWKEEAGMIFGPAHHDKVSILMVGVLGTLAPAAIQQLKEQKARDEEKKQKEEAERKKREEALKEYEAQKAEQQAAKEKKEAEEEAERQRQAQELAAAETARAVAEAAETNREQQAQEEPQAMEGVESNNAAPEAAQQPAAAPTERIITTIRNGETVDVTDLGIDPDYLAALPEEFREEVIAQTLTTRRSEARQQAPPEGENREAFQEFLEALPSELRDEIVQQERQERRRRERDEARRQNNNDPARRLAEAAEMDAASILLTFPPALREQVLLEQGEDIMDQLPPDLAAQARALAQQSSQQYRGPPPNARAVAGRQVLAEPAAVNDGKPQRRTIVQMLDKAGVATLLRLMFITQHGSIRNYLFDVFSCVCENRQNRLEVISTLLQILQDGSTDMDAVERSFGQLSLRAKQAKEKDATKTPQSLKRTFTNISTHNHHLTNNSEVSPLLIVQQCLDLLQDLATKNAHIPSLFLTEHETVASTLKRNLSRKGKGKDVNLKAQKYAINCLLALLDRSLVMESSAVMQLLADLLNKVTYPLQALERRRKEAEAEAKKKEEEAKKKEEERAKGETSEPAVEHANTEAVNMANVQAPPAAAAAPSGDQPTQEDAQKDAQDKETKETKETKPEEKKVRQLTPPYIPDHNLKLVVNIFVARECSSKTFQNTISTIKNLSNIPGAKKVFGEELVRQARVLSENIVSDLNDLLPYILKAESGTEIQGVALAKFSPGASEQNKLLRVLTALDHLFDSKGKGKKEEGASEAEDSKEGTKEDLLGSLYWNPTFGTMWDKLSACLSAIRQRENMLNVATILLPLIESLMVVCKNTTLGDAPSVQHKELLLSSPPPENRIAGLFFSFTEEHRRILNELVRHNPKLMSGTFSLLVKNPKVLEFDNKRNYFNRSVHSKTGTQQTRPQYNPLQLSVRREHVFHDSFKSLYFKTGDEMKFGKLNIRFHGEEGVDAGGVTREWFQVLARQMFDPNYALFIPVSSDRTTFHPNQLSSINEEHLMFFKFIGRIIGKALYEGRLLDCYFSRAVYKRILGKPVSVKDMESFDPNYYKSLVWILENDITDIITETFSVEDDEFGVTKTVDLIPDGRNIPVTEENKSEYVRLIVEHKLLTSVKDQMEHFLKGFHDIIPEELIAIFNEQELELLISGLPDIDVDDWKSNTEYHNYTAASQQIQWFWRAIRSFDKEERAKLLQFVTGTSKVPLNGFKELEGMNGVSRFNIHRDYGNKDRLPSSHTCFNQLDLPEYESYDTLRSQILKAITAGSDYFGFA
ncbi:E3 ubiquitin-protein ligase tom1 [Podospora pseudoanserina]|uniref:HECT-type E3 ubiquitin transferase n=1 Tax=Podospora pseudoanserina TaxID=2609844 RepID=A0ABR0IE26_9PEZI|nr:E3 ubiquitin-protein ligase tom1 [Podospora pseudoanserina]